ncbi:hypothetical protein FRB95_005980 [Tulasnella sp. JGI-2019a]|nr:hypothetical protein FRB95_005980 [Tulasnella sp. JGI-2019a]
MRYCSLFAALLFRQCHVSYGSLALVEDQPLSGIISAWSWSQSFIDVISSDPVKEFVSRPASFGPHITEEPGLPGYLIPVSSLPSKCPVGNPLPPVTPTRQTDLPDNLGCPIVCGQAVMFPKATTMAENWIALVQRGECPFADKARAAQALGAKGVIVGGYTVKEGEKDDLLNMFSPQDSSDIKIPATYVTYRSYNHLMEMIAASNTTTSGTKTISIIWRAEESWGWLSPLVTFVMLLILPSLLTFLTLAIHRLREVRRERLDRAPEDFVNHLPTRIWSGSGWEKESDWIKKLRRRAQEAQSEPGGDKVDKEPVVDLESQLLDEPPATRQREEDVAGSQPANNTGCCASNRQPATSDSYGSTDQDEIPARYLPWFEGQSECAICLSTFEQGDKVRILPCGHLFHIEEVDSWLVQRKKLCPVCKIDVTLPFGQPSSTPHDRNESGTPLPTLMPNRSTSMSQRLREWFNHPRLPIAIPFFPQIARVSGPNTPSDPVPSPPTERTGLLAAHSEMNS